MASVIWMSVFFFLVAELFVVAILVLPMPRRVRKFIAKKIIAFNLGPRIRFATQWVTFGLLAALVESVTTLRRLEAREDRPISTGHGFENHAGYIEISLEKQRKFRAERNLYLAGFSLTLLFVIARIVELLQETIHLEEDRDLHKKRINEITSVGRGSEISAASAGESASTLRQRAGTSSKKD